GLRRCHLLPSPFCDEHVRLILRFVSKTVVWQDSYPGANATLAAPPVEPSARRPPRRCRRDAITGYTLRAARRQPVAGVFRVVRVFLRASLTNLLAGAVARASPP